MYILVKLFLVLHLSITATKKYDFQKVLTKAQVQIAIVLNVHEVPSWRICKGNALKIRKTTFTSV
jgi:hypothetical protein